MTTGRASRPPVHRLSALRGGLLFGLLATATLAFGSGTTITTAFSDNDVLVHLPAGAPDTTNASVQNPAALEQQLRQYILNARQKGDPRFLGYAQSALDRWPEARMTDGLLLMRATVRQSLHQFTAARSDLKQVLSGTPHRQHRAQATLTLATLDTVQGQYQEAMERCITLARLHPGLVAASCQAQAQARSGQAEVAYERLKTLTDDTRSPDRDARAWAQGTLADIAAQLGRADAQTHWRLALAQNPQDLHTRTRLADWLIQHERYGEALALTRDHVDVDAIAVLRAIALEALDDPAAEQARKRLQQRFSEARWRDDMLHKRDYARYLLDVRHQPDEALAYARENWKDQKEPTDTRLLLRAALANEATADLERVIHWLAENNQHDARYPEVQR